MVCFYWLIGRILNIRSVGIQISGNLKKSMTDVFDDLEARKVIAGCRVVYNMVKAGKPTKRFVDVEIIDMCMTRYVGLEDEFPILIALFFENYFLCNSLQKRERDNTASNIAFQNMIALGMIIEKNHME